ncbi:hypothetical protein [Streptomyces sp. NPDC058955]|uniref:hypothetical protein n=1 Tax=unclassified Streptomyces TaxID=2593676 RepID=UPI00366377FA
MTSRLRRRPGEAASFLFTLLVMAIASRRRGPGRCRLRRIATSAEVRRSRELAERRLRARAAEIEEGSPWGPPLRTSLVDVCSRGGGRNLLDQNAPRQPAMTCVMRLHLYFVVDRPVPQVLEDLRAMTAPVAWSASTIDSTLRHYPNRTAGTPYTWPPSINSRTGGERLAWDAPGDDPKAKLPEPCPRHRTVLRTCVSDPADLTLAALRERPGTLFVWTLTTGYEEVHSPAGRR